MENTTIAQPAAQPELVNHIVFYCKDCRELVSAIKVGRKYVYRCPKCSTKNVAFGTVKSIKNFYHVDDRPKTAPPTPVKS